jgi:hypothetical protein
MILSDKDLQKNPAKVMASVFEFVGLPPTALDILDNPKAVEELIAKQWPDFESDTGEQRVGACW